MKLIAKLMILVSCIVFPFLVYIILFADGKIDRSYLKLTTGKQNSLIIGASRGAVGIKPSLFNDNNYYFEGPLYNFCFIMNESPYGPGYLNAIKNKLHADTKDGLFILDVSPIVVSYKYTENTSESVEKLWEADGFMNKLYFFNFNPNFDYILKSYAQPYYFMFMRRFISNMTIKDDGWLEIKNIPMDSVNLNKRKQKCFHQYKTEFLLQHKFSKIRFNYLAETVKYLSHHGSVWVVRLPVDKTLYEMELNYMPDFDSKIEEMAKANNIKYINLVKDYESYHTYDGNHLYFKSAEAVTKEILKYVSSQKSMEKSN